MAALGGGLKTPSHPQLNWLTNRPTTYTIGGKGMLGIKAGGSPSPSIPRNWRRIGKAKFPRVWATVPKIQISRPPLWKSPSARACLLRPLSSRH